MNENKNTSNKGPKILANIQKLKSNLSSQTTTDLKTKGVLKTHFLVILLDSFTTD